MPTVQERTALADTPGSRFTSKCEALIAEVDFGELLSEFTAHIDLLFKKITDKGEGWYDDDVAMRMLLLCILTTSTWKHACIAASLDCCLDVLIHIAPRVPEDEWPEAAAKVSAALTAEVSSSC